MGCDKFDSIEFGGCLPEHKLCMCVLLCSYHMFSIDANVCRAALQPNIALRHSAPMLNRQLLLTPNTI